MSGKPRIGAVAIALLASFGIWAAPLPAQVRTHGPASRKFFVGSSLFVLANFVPDDNKPDFVQLNLVY